MQSQSEHAPIIITITDEERRRPRALPTRHLGAYTRAFIQHCPDRLFPFVENHFGKAKITRNNGLEFYGCWQITKDGVTLQSPTPKFLGFGMGEFESKCERHFKINPTDVCVDVGACIGDTTVPMLMKATKGFVYGVEPHPVNLDFLTRNLDNYKNYQIVPVAAWNKKEQLTFHTHKAPTGHSIIENVERKGTIVVEADTLDNLFRSVSVDFAKIDVQGAEVQVLEGAQQFMDKTDKLVVETHNRYDVAKRTFPRVLESVKKHYGNVKFELDNGCVYCWR